MNLWIVERSYWNHPDFGYSYCETSFEGVFSTKEKAVAFVKEMSEIYAKNTDVTFEVLTEAAVLDGKL